MGPDLLIFLMAAIYRGTIKCLIPQYFGLIIRNMVCSIVNLWDLLSVTRGCWIYTNQPESKKICNEWVYSICKVTCYLLFWYQIFCFLCVWNFEKYLVFNDDIYLSSFWSPLSYFLGKSSLTSTRSALCVFTSKFCKKWMVYQWRIVIITMHFLIQQLQFLGALAGKKYSFFLLWAS